LWRQSSWQWRRLLTITLLPSSCEKAIDLPLAASRRFRDEGLRLKHGIDRLDGDSVTLRRISTMTIAAAIASCALLFVDRVDARRYHKRSYHIVVCLRRRPWNAYSVERVL
jgi:hypothetical protein